MLKIIRTADARASAPYEGVCRARSIENPEFVGYGPDAEAAKKNLAGNIAAGEKANPGARVVADFMLLTDEQQRDTIAEMSRVRRSR